MTAKTPARRRSFWHLMFMAFIWLPLTIWIETGHLGKGALYRDFTQVTVAHAVARLAWVLAGFIISVIIMRILIKGK